MWMSRVEHSKPRPGARTTLQPDHDELMRDIAATKKHLGALKRQMERLSSVNQGHGRKRPHSDSENLINTVLLGRGRESSSYRLKKCEQCSNLCPVLQIEPMSALGLAFRNLKGGQRQHSPGDSNDSSSNESEDNSESPTSSSDKGTDEQSTDSSMDYRTHGWWKEKLLHHSCHSSRRHKEVKVPILKPKEPEAYDGRPNIEIFHKFMMETSEYLEEYHVPPRLCASKVA